MSAATPISPGGFSLHGRRRSIPSSGSARGRPVATGTLDLSANFEATGRSPAGLVSALTGGGAIAIHQGEARYVNPSAASLVIGASDLGQQFTDDALERNFASYIDAGTLPFGEAERRLRHRRRHRPAEEPADRRRRTPRRSAAPPSTSTR